MTAPAPDPIMLLLAKLVLLGIQVEPFQGHLRYRPESLMTHQLASQIKAHKDELVRLLVGLESPDQGHQFSPAELALMDAAGVRHAPLVAAVKQTFPQAALIQIRPIPPRIQAGRLIRQARRAATAAAVALRDTWHDRLAICIDGGLDAKAAEMVALEEIMSIAG